MLKKNLILFLFIFSFEFSLVAQDTIKKPDTLTMMDTFKRQDTLTMLDTLKKPEKNKYNLSELVHEAGSYVIRPIKWKGKDWLKFAVVAAGTFALTQVDQPVYDVAEHNPGYSKNTIIFVGKQWGGFFFPPALTLSLYLHGLIFDNHKTKKIGFELAQAMIYSEMISFPLKGIFGRSRPKFNHGAFAYHPFTSIADSPRNSFPAGHVTGAFAVSTVLSRNINSGFFKVLVYAPAVLCVVERVYTGNHWLSDCFFGAALGTFTGIWLTRIHKEKESRLTVSSIYPFSMKYALN